MKITELICYKDFNKFMEYVEKCVDLYYDMQIFYDGISSDLGDPVTIQGSVWIALNHFLLSGNMEPPRTKEDVFMLPGKNDNWDALLCEVSLHYLAWVDMKQSNLSTWWFDEKKNDIRWFSILDLVKAIDRIKKNETKQ
jgi:hypothetical protein